MTLAEQIALVLAQKNFGKPSAVKRGRNPAWPYVPVVVYPGRTQNHMQGLAFITRDEAIAAAQRWIDAQRQGLAERLADPRMRALREQHGLPREI